MSTRLIIVLSVVLSCLHAQTASSQSSWRFGALPSLNLNKKVGKDWALNSKIEARQLVLQKDFDAELDQAFEYVLTDFSLIASKKVGLNARLAGGYLIRLEGEEQAHRFIQQYISVQRFSGFRLAHRILSDQTFSAEEGPEFRLRYRIASEIPFNGESLDPGELYLKINNEYLNSLQSGEYDLEVRLIPLLGYGLSESLKIETGLDYRVNSFLNSVSSQSYWWSLNLFIEI